MLFAGFLSGAQRLEQPPTCKVPHLAAIRQYDTHRGLEPSWHLDSKTFFAPYDPVVTGHPSPTHLLVLASDLLAIEVHSMLWARIAPCCPLLEMFLITMHSEKSVKAVQKTLTPYIPKFLVGFTQSAFPEPHPLDVCSRYSNVCVVMIFVIATIEMSFSVSLTSQFRAIVATMSLIR